MKYEICWTSANGQGYLNGGDFDADADFAKEIEGFRKELLAQCANDDEIEGINAGTIEVRELVDG